MALALCAGLVVYALWRAGLLVSMQDAFVLQHRVGSNELITPQGWLAALLMVAAAVGAGFAVERVGARRSFPFVGGGLLLLCVLSLLASRHMKIDIAFAPMALAVVAASLLVQLHRLWRVDLLLMDGVRRVAHRPAQLHGRLETKEQLANGLKILELMLPLEEAVIFQPDADGEMVQAARLRSAAQVSGHETDRNFAWREWLSICREALATAEMVQAREPLGAAPVDKVMTLAFPLKHDDRVVGALLLRLRQPPDQNDDRILKAVCAQLARDLQRERAQHQVLARSSLTFISARSTTGRLEAFSMLSALLAEQACGEQIIFNAIDAYALAYLDGTLAAVNGPMLEAARLKSEEALRLDIFGLLDQFRTGIFDEPSIAVRRVLRTGEPYECELQFVGRNQTLALRITLIGNLNSDALDAGQPLGLLVTVRDMTLVKEYEKLKSDMISLMSHEMRTPITSINGFAELLVQDEQIPEEAREFLAIIRNESQRLSRMINTFLAVTQLEATDKQEFSKIPLRLDDVVRETLLSLQPVAKKKRIRLVEQQPSRLPPIAADKSLITQAVNNLIGNAIKYSPERTTVTVSTVLEADAVRVSVEDRGFGIPPEAVDRVWEKFYRVPRDGQEKDEESTGLGLSFVREIVEQHGGFVSLETEVGRGSRFSFTLPRL
ncbi:MAG TPA: ATP-binding protein [Pyrinomonadaceae bacterium]|jgi:signal transduction histidine kinase